MKATTCFDFLVTNKIIFIFISIWPKNLTKKFEKATCGTTLLNFRMTLFLWDTASHPIKSQEIRSWRRVFFQLAKDTLVYTKLN